jgi:hypothetical protein
MDLIYRALFNYVIDSPNLGLLVKPKKLLEDTALASGELRSLLDKAVATGRCLALVRETGTEPKVRPYEAALAADLAVGYPINTAVVEAVLAGVPGVHIDLTHEPGHPFYESGYEQVVFDDLDRAMQAIRRWGDNDPEAAGLGDNSAVIDGIDPFRDGKAAHRVGQYMTWLWQGFDQGLARDDVVRMASRMYADEYGEQHVQLAPRLRQP